MFSKIIAVALLMVCAQGAMANSAPFEIRPAKVMSDDAQFINGPIYIVSNSSIEVADYPNLEFVNGPIYIVGNAKLTQVNFPKLKRVNGPIYVSYNFSLASVTYPMITFVNGPIYFYANKK